MDYRGRKNRNYVIYRVVKGEVYDMQIPTDIMVALIGLAGSAFGAFIGVLASAKLTNYRIEQLEKKVDKHNTVIERTYKLEEAQAVIQEQIKVANHRIGDLEKEREE
jgi:hypothetical protein